MAGLGASYQYNRRRADLSPRSIPLSRWSGAAASSALTDEFQFRWNARKFDDTARANKALSQIKGKRLTYRPTDEAQDA